MKNRFKLLLDEDFRKLSKNAENANKKRSINFLKNGLENFQ